MPNLLEICGITIEELIELYNKEGSVRKLYKKLGVSRPTVTKWLKIAGVKTIPHRHVQPPTTSIQSEFGVVAKWIKANPHEKLPASVKLAAAKIGCSERALYSYLFRRSTKVIRYINSFGDIRDIGVTLTTTDGRRVKTTYVDEYKIKFNPKTYIVRVHLRIKNTNFTCKYPLKELLTILRNNPTMS